MKSGFDLKRAELMPLGTIKNWKLYKAKEAQKAKLKEENLKAQRLGLVPAEPLKPNPTPREQLVQITPRERDRVPTFEQWNRSTPQGQRPYSWMTTSPYNMSGVETRDE